MLVTGVSSRPSLHATGIGCTSMSESFVNTRMGPTACAEPRLATHRGHALKSSPVRPPSTLGAAVRSILHRRNTCSRLVRAVQSRTILRARLRSRSQRVPGVDGSRGPRVPSRGMCSRTLRKPKGVGMSSFRGHRGCGPNGPGGDRYLLGEMPRWGNRGHSSVSVRLTMEWPTAAHILDYRPIFF